MSQFKAAKDALVSSLYELSKAANDASSATVNFYNASLTTDEASTKIFGDLADSLKLLTRAAEGVSATAHTIAGEEVMLPVLGDVPQLPTSIATVDVVEAAAPAKQKKKVEKDPYAPKKPLTVFFAYSSFIREAIRNERAANDLPPFAPKEITQEISRRWNDLSDQEKSMWKEAYNKELLTYQVSKEKYLEDKKNGTAQSETITSAPVPLPAHLFQQSEKSSKKRSSDGLSKEEKKKKKKEKKEKRKSLVDASMISV